MIRFITVWRLFPDPEWSNFQEQIGSKEKLNDLYLTKTHLTIINWMTWRVNILKKQTFWISFFDSLNTVILSLCSYKNARVSKSRNGYKVCHCCFIQSVIRQKLIFEVTQKWKKMTVKSTTSQGSVTNKNK